MELEIIKEMENVKVLDFDGDNLYKEYDFITGEFKELLIPENFIKDLLYANVKDYFKNGKIYDKIIDICESCNFALGYRSNFNIIEGRLVLGNDMARITEKLEIYKEYLNNIKNSGYIVKIKIK